MSELIRHFLVTRAHTQPVGQAMAEWVGADDVCSHRLGLGLGGAAAQLERLGEALHPRDDQPHDGRGKNQPRRP
jgi:hypothetical protein